MTLEHATILLAAVTFLLAVLTVFGDRIRSLVWHPVLTLKAQMSSPEAHKTTMTRRGDAQIRTDCYYFLIRVENSGSTRAENVELFVKDLKKRGIDEGYHSVGGFLPMNLLMSFTRQPVLKSLSPGLHKHCSLGHVIDPAHRREFPSETHPDFRGNVTQEGGATFVLDVEFQSNNLFHLLKPGEYEIGLTLAASNAKTSDWSLRITHIGVWSGNETEMFERGTSISLRRA